MFQNYYQIAGKPSWVFSFQIQGHFEANLLILQTYCSFVHNRRGLGEHKLDHFSLKTAERMHYMNWHLVHRTRCDFVRSRKPWGAFIACIIPLHQLLHSTEHSGWFTLPANIGTACVEWKIDRETQPETKWVLAYLVSHLSLNFGEIFHYV